MSALRRQAHYFSFRQESEQTKSECPVARLAPAPNRTSAHGTNPLAFPQGSITPGTRSLGSESLSCPGPHAQQGTAGL